MITLAHSLRGALKIVSSNRSTWYLETGRVVLPKVNQQSELSHYSNNACQKFSVDTHLNNSQQCRL